MKLLTINNIAKHIDIENITISVKKKKQKKSINYYNVPISFDIETTSFMEKNEKVALMYHWQFAINENVITGRTWKDFQNLLEVLHILFHTNLPPLMRIIIRIISFVKH